MKYIYYRWKLLRYVDRLNYDVRFVESALKDFTDEFSNENFKEKTGFEHENFLRAVEMGIEDIQDLKKLSNKTLNKIENSLKDICEIIREER